MHILYTILYIHLLPIFVLRLLIRARKAPLYAKRIGERFAFIPKRNSDKALIWVHAVSVGEVIAAIPMVQQLKQRYPDKAICITTTTPTGSERVKAAFADTVLHYYLPYDVPSLLLRFILLIRPELLIIMETELWPNLLMVCEDKKIPVVLVNARMSDRSAKGYQRFASITKPMLKRLTFIAAQSPADNLRFCQLGADADKVYSTGSIKFDISLTEAVLQRKKALVQQLNLLPNTRKVITFASTHVGEDEQIIPMIKRLIDIDASVLCLIVPRHPERFAVVKTLLQQAQLRFISVSDEKPINADVQVLVGDTMGDMLAFYGLSQLAFIGGSLINHGGHNMLEAALWALPIISGKYVFNFQTISDSLQQAQGLLLVNDVAELEQYLMDWLARAELPIDGANALHFLQQNQGALTRVLERLDNILKNNG